MVNWSCRPRRVPAGRCRPWCDQKGRGGGAPALLVLGCGGGLRPGWSRVSLTLFAAVRRRFAPGGARSFLLLAQEKRTKEKAPLHARPSGSLPGCGGCLTGHPWPGSQRADVLSAPLTGLILHPSAAPEGEGEQREALPASRTRKIALHDTRSRVLADMSHVSLDGFELAALNPSGGGGARRTRPEGWPTGCRPFFCGPWMARQKNPAARNALVGRSPASAGRGCPSLWFVSLGQAREMNERPQGVIRRRTAAKNVR